MHWNWKTTCQPGRITGDIVFVVEQEAHAKFKRKGNDLFVEHSLSLIEAQWGFQFVMTHLDNRHLLIKSNPAEVVKPGKLRQFLVSPQFFKSSCCFKLS